ncbi:hypothetical protein DPMN_108344 [Dreissena polymorpha]|uniref:Uncharacterized protein n=1 Tax=Dreissena polymorpha TaxID=45954 RepID=A0A9D4K8L9_DREPO|nr:hypothetical protein DPMN_108344 [Dreissena polymorpha]
MATSLATNNGFVVSTNRSIVELPLYETMSISGLVRKSTQDSAAFTEPSDKVSGRIGVYPRVFRLDSRGNTARVSF